MQRLVTEVQSISISMLSQTVIPKYRFLKSGINAALMIGTLVLHLSTLAEESVTKASAVYPGICTLKHHLNREALG